MKVYAVIVFKRSHYNFPSTIQNVSHKRVLYVFKRNEQLYYLPTIILPSDYSPRPCNTCQQTWVPQFNNWKIPVYQITLQEQKQSFYRTWGTIFFIAFATHTHI